VSAPEQSSPVERAVDDLWRYYEEHAAQARQHEDLRATVTSILVGFAAALVGFAGIGGLEPSDAPAGVLIIVLGVLGALLSLKHYERNRFHVRVLGTVRGEITRLRSDPQRAPLSTETLRDQASEEHGKEFSLRRRSMRQGSWLARMSLFQLWLALPLAVAAVGALIVGISLA
jgi:hypothetical protein